MIAFSYLGYLLSLSHILFLFFDQLESVFQSADLHTPIFLVSGVSLFLIASRPRGTASLTGAR